MIMMPAVLTVCVIVMMYLHVGLCGDACCVDSLCDCYDVFTCGIVWWCLLCWQSVWLLWCIYMWDCVVMPAVLTVCVIVMMYLHVGLCDDACCVDSLWDCYDVFTCGIVWWCLLCVDRACGIVTTYNYMHVGLCDDACWMLRACVIVTTYMHVWLCDDTPAGCWQSLWDCYNLYACVMISAACLLTESVWLLQHINIHV